MTVENTILNYDTLVEYYLANKVQNISLLKKLAIKETVSFQYEWFIHKHMRMETKESFNFSTYVCLIQAEPEYYGNFIEVMIDDIGIDEDVIEKCLQYIRSGFIPYQIWIDKVIADLKGSDYYSKTSVEGMLLVYLMKTMQTSILGYLKLHKALIDADISDEINNVVYTANAMFLQLPKDIKDKYMEMFTTEDNDLRDKFMDNELSLFTETLIDMTQYPINLQTLMSIERGEVPATTQFWDEPMIKPAPIINRSRNKLSVSAEDSGDITKNTGMGNFMNFITPDNNDNDETVIMGTEPAKVVDEYIVEKVAVDSSSRVMSKNKFKTKDEAINFVEDVVQAVPDVTNYFKFRINGTEYTPKRLR